MPSESRTPYFSLNWGKLSDRDVSTASMRVVKISELTEVAKKADIEAFHRNAERDHHAPTNGLRVQLNALPQGHPMFLVGRALSIPDHDRVSVRMFKFILGWEVERLIGSPSLFVKML